ncbi:His/Gly/Thr/Pro-type tRNA ligase C-terminal domain-containing protein, partial [Actinomyces sp.]
DEIGTPLCITYDFDSIEDHAVTIRERDTMEQVRIPLDTVKSYLIERLGC